MKKEVILFECDNHCGNTAEAEDIHRNHRGTPTPLPAGWVEFRGLSNHGIEIDLQLCKECTDAIRLTLLERKLILETSNEKEEV